MTNAFPCVLLAILLLADSGASDPAAIADNETTQSNPSAAARNERKRALPLYRDWFEQQGIELPLFDEEIRAWLDSGRLGWQGPTRWGPARAWGAFSKWTPSARSPSRSNCRSSARWRSA
jgi:hypothetical protein